MRGGERYKSKDKIVVNKKLTTTQYKKRSAIIRTTLKIVFMLFIIISLYLYVPKYINKMFPTQFNYNNNYYQSTNINKNKTSKTNITYLNNTSIKYKDSNQDDTKSDITSPTIYSNKEEKEISSSKIDSEEYIPSNNENNSSGSYTTSNSEELNNHFNFSDYDFQNEINDNNEQIEKLKKQQEELDALKSDYETKKKNIETWYIEEYKKNSSLMLEAQRNMEDAGGRASQDDVNNAYKKIKSLKTELSNNGLLNSGYGQEQIKQAEKNYETILKRFSYTKEYDKFYYYINTTLASEKTSKLSIITNEYNKSISELKSKYNLQ